MQPQRASGVRFAGPVLYFFLLPQSLGPPRLSPPIPIGQKAKHLPLGASAIAVTTKHESYMNLKVLF